MEIPRMKFFDPDDSGYGNPSDEDIKGLFVEDEEQPLEGDDSGDNDSSNDSDGSDTSDSTANTNDIDKEEGTEGDQDQQGNDSDNQEGQDSQESTDSQEQPKKTYRYKANGQIVEKELTDEEVLQELSKADGFTQKTQNLAENRKLIDQLQEATGYSLQEIVNFYMGNTQVQSDEGQQQTQDDQGDKATNELAKKVAQIENLIGRAMAVNKVQAELMELKSQEKYKDIDEKELLERAGKESTNNFKLVADQILYEKTIAEMDTFKENTRKEIEEEFKKSDDARKKAELVDGGTNQSTSETEPDKYGKDGVEDFLKKNPNFSLID